MDGSEDFMERDEVVADSEDEMMMEELGSSNNGGRGSAISMPPPRQIPELSSIAAFSSVRDPDNSSISAFTGRASPFGTMLDERSFAKDADTSGYSNFFADTSTGTMSIADRAKTRKRKPTDVLELTSDEDDEIRIKPTKSKSKPKDKGPKTVSTPQVNEPSTSNSAAKDSSESSGSKPRPRPRPIAKKPRTENAAFLEATNALDPQSSTTGGQKPVVQTTPRKGLPSSSSNLPPSSFSTGVPHIETIANDDDLFDGPLSSPSSLFDDGDAPSTRKKKQKRKSYPSDREMEIDELVPSDPPPLPDFHFYDKPVSGPPPPTFFAGSSQPAEVPEPAVSSSKVSTSSHVAPTSDADVIDLTDLPATFVPPKSVKKPSKAKKPHKKTSEEDFSAWDEAGAAGVYVFDDDQDEDFNPSGDVSGKKKAKSKGKAKEKPAKGSKGKGKGKGKNLDSPLEGIPQQNLEDLNPEQDADSTHVEPPVKIPEVVITTKPARKAKKTKDKNKDKSNAHDTSTSNKEAFKSREFIDDSGDDAPAPQTATSEAQPASFSEPNAVETPERPSTSADMPAASKHASNGKRRSRVVQSDDEDELVLRPSTSKKVDATLEEGPEEWEKLENGGINQPDEVIRHSKVKEGKKKGKATKKGKEKESKVAEDKADSEAPAASTKNGDSRALEETFDEPPEEEDEEVVVVPKPGRKGARKTVVDDDDVIPDDDEQTGGKLDETGAFSKENRAPKTASNLVTPNTRPSSSTNANDSLYSRYEIAPRSRGPSMSELIRRANSHPSSPFANTLSDNNASANGKLKSRTSLTPISRVYSPYAKSSRRLLNKIAPLHPNRRTPPPPPPPIPPKKKTKKEIEREEKWEEELVESIGGLEAWAALGDDERREMRRAKFAMEMGGWDD
ncbi:hypothetical protein CVT24_004638 [Panaeolus cyanescens]|uniref:Uncharacterized protein n=1 Tax=Panaeolus cyanescens TaxID=181874 RepID=A0A409YSI8_9AGAR|nr:hypothetical protein CVT24_004638 [Panaeolus cyanescens]